MQSNFSVIFATMYPIWIHFIRKNRLLLILYPNVVLVFPLIFQIWTFEILSQRWFWRARCFNLVYAPSWARRTVFLDKNRQCLLGAIIPHTLWNQILLKEIGHPDILGKSHIHRSILIWATPLRVYIYIDIISNITP